jgi:predicted nuclease with RNAse H fold
MFAGIDLGADRIQCVALDDELRVAGTWLFTAGELDELVATLEGVRTVGVDAPAQLSSMPHRDDDRLSPKFRPARCAEIALGREYGYWVPWVTPAEKPAGWIATGLDVYEALAEAELPTVEVYPYAGFRALAPLVTLPKKTSIKGLRERIERLENIGVRAPTIAAWSHDGLDAVLGAVIARDSAHGTARQVTCEHDDSAIWLPAKVSE